MADLTIQNVVEAGLTETLAAATAGGDAIINTGADTILHVKNAGAGAVAVTITAQRTSKTVGGFGAMTKANIVVTVAAGAESFIGPFPVSAFDDSTGRVQITYDQVLTVTVAALRVPRAA